MSSATSVTAQLLIGHRDPCDVDILALTLETETPLWSNDADFEKIDQIILLNIEDIMELIRFLNADKLNL